MIYDNIYNDSPKNHKLFAARTFASLAANRLSSTSATSMAPNKIPTAEAQST